MKLITKVVIGLVLPALLAGCDQPIEKFSDGSVMETRAVSDGATEWSVMKYQDAKTGATAFKYRSTDSIKGRTIPAATTAFVGAATQGVAGVAIARENNKGCSGDGCGGSGDTFLIQGGEAVAAAKLDSNVNSTNKINSSACDANPAICAQ